MRGATAALMAVLAAGCATTNVVVVPSRRVTQYAVIAAGTPLRTRAEADAPSVMLPVAALFRRVRARGAWLEVETAARAERQCVPVIAPPEGMRLRFFVASDAVRPVTADDASARGPDGAWQVRTGVLADGNSLVHAGLRITPGTMPPTRDAHPAVRPQPVPASGERLAPGTTMTLPDGARAEVLPGAVVPVRSRRAAAEGARVTVELPCARVEAVVPASAVLPVLDLDVEDRDAPTPVQTEVGAGTALRWPDGSPAGRALGPASVPGEGRTVDDARCWRVALRVAGATPAVAPLETEVCAVLGPEAAP